jgi:hypothetical protein
MQMNWLKLKLRNWANSAQDIYENVPMKMATAGSIGIGRGPSLDSDKGIRFQVYKANGGMVVETSTYDRHKDRSYNGLYIITDGKDLGQEIAKIITMETLKQ